MTMKTVVICTKVNKKCRSSAFVGLKIGDKVEFSCELQTAGKSSRGTYATYVKCRNLQNESVSFLSFNQMHNPLVAFDWEEI